MVVRNLMQHQELARPHDLLVRRLLNDPELMRDLLLYYTQKIADQRMVELLNLKHLECKSPVAISEQLMEGIGDLRFTASFKGSGQQSNVILLFEHQSSINQRMRFRGLKYIVQTYDQFEETRKGNEKFPYPVVVVLYHGTTSWKHLPEMDELIDIVPGVETGLLKYTLVLIDISILKKDEFKGHPVLQALLEALQLASEKRLVDEFDRVIDRIVPVKDDPRADGWLRSFCRYALSVAKIGTEQIIKAFSKILTEEEAHEMTMTTAQELWVGGETKAGRNMVITVLRARFKEIPEEVEQAILAMSDLIALESWAAQAATCQSMDEFAQALR
jgi:hypothetical protein